MQPHRQFVHRAGRAGSAYTGPLPREIGAVGNRSSMCWKDQASCGAVCQLSSVTPVAGRLGFSPITGRSLAACYSDLLPVAWGGPAGGTSATPEYCARIASMNWRARMVSAGFPLPVCSRPLVTSTPRSAPFHR